MGRDRSADSTFKWVVFAGIVLFGSLAIVSDSLGPASIPIWISAMVGLGYALRGPLGAALAQRIAGTVPGDAALAEETAVELDELRRRLYELEERVDFSERLLVQRPAVPAAGEAPPA